MPFPVILLEDFHGYYDTGQLQAEQSGIKEIADRYNFMAVWPNGLDDTIWEGQGTCVQTIPSMIKVPINVAHCCSSQCHADTVRTVRTRF